MPVLPQPPHVYLFNAVVIPPLGRAFRLLVACFTAHTALERPPRRSVKASLWPIEQSTIETWEASWTRSHNSCQRWRPIRCINPLDGEIRQTSVRTNLATFTALTGALASPRIEACLVALACPCAPGSVLGTHGCAMSLCLASWRC